MRAGVEGLWLRAIKIKRDGGTKPPTEPYEFSQPLLNALANNQSRSTTASTSLQDHRCNLPL
jgi:hypothetical protein